MQISSLVSSAEVNTKPCDISIIIAHRGDPMGLWATVSSCDLELQNSDLTYEYRIVANGSGKEKVYPDLDRVIHFTRKTGRLGFFENVPEPMTPPAARQRASVGANGKLLFFFDNHILVAKDYFKRAVLDFITYKCDMLHSTTLFYTGEFTHYHYKLHLEKDFWCESSPLPEHPFKPYRIAVAGHGGFAVRRDVWEEVGGYGPEDMFTGYGGEESYFDLKMAMLGKSNYLDPKIIHYHYTGVRGYHRHNSDDYFRNLMTCAYVIGGQKWLDKVYGNFTQYPKMLSTATMFQLYEEAYERAQPEAAWMKAHRLRTLDEQLKYFFDNQIAC